MKPATKLALRRFALRWLRKLVDVVDDRLHAAEVNLRNDLASARVSAAGCTSAVSQQREFRVASPRREDSAAPAQENTFAQWEARRSGIAPISKKAVRKRRERPGAAAFDLRYAR